MADDQITATIKVSGSQPGRAEQMADSLEAVLRPLSRLNVDIKREKKPGTQDFGATIVLVLGAPAVIVLANAVRDWARRTDTTDIMINEISVTNVRSEDAAEIIRAIRGGGDANTRQKKSTQG